MNINKIFLLHTALTLEFKYTSYYYSLMIIMTFEIITSYLNKYYYCYTMNFLRIASN